MTIIQAKDAKFGVGICSSCDVLACTYGQHSHGGIRYCQECFKSTLSWVQLGEMQEAMLILWDKIAQSDPIKAQFEKVGNVSPELRKAIGDGEAVRRLYESEA